MAKKINRTQQINNPFPTITNVTFQNSWANYAGGTEYGACGYYKDAMGIVHLRGLMSSGTLNAAAFTLPVGCRPTHRLIFTQLTGGNNTVGRIDILPDGTVVPQAGVNNAWVTLEGISFIALQ